MRTMIVGEQAPLKSMRAWDTGDPDQPTFISEAKLSQPTFRRITSPRRKWNLCTLSLAVVSCLVLLMAGVKLRQDPNGALNDSSSSSSSDGSTPAVSSSYWHWTVESATSAGLDVVASNEYTRANGPSATQYPWVANRTVLEPFKEALFELSGSLAEQEGLTFALTVQLVSPDAIPEVFDITMDSPVTATLRSVGTYRVTVEASTGSSVVKSTSQEVLCRYVRRELRALSRDDKDRMLKSMEVLYRVPTASGQLLYGAGYLSAGEFVRVHNHLAGQRDCDHMHDGLGFLTLHTALTMQFEQVMQLVDPAVVMHYWDYTIDAERYYDAQGDDISNFYNSEVFFSDWFGGVVQDRSDNVVSDGRFAYVSVDPTSYNIKVDTTNAYGLLRSPWNGNPVPFVSRANTTYGAMQSNPPGCQWHFEQMKYTDWTDFAMEIQYRPHGKIHTLVAGVWGANWLPKFREYNYESNNHGAGLALEAFGFQKDMWRAGLLQCPDSCSADTPATDCRCTCPELSAWIEQDTAHAVLFNNVQMAHGDYTNADGEDLADLFLRLLCNDFEEMAPQIGDLMNSAAPADPLFWPIHPTVDRLWQWRRINGMTNESWPSGAADYARSDDSCKGHGPDDVTVFKSLFGEDTGDSAEVSFYTNQELYEGLSPLRESNNAVFADFRWGHCEHLGYPIDLMPSKFVAKDQERFTGDIMTDCESGKQSKGACL